MNLDILAQICQYLPLEAILSLLKVNKNLKSLMSSDTFWEKLSLLMCSGILNAKGEWKSSFFSLHKKRPTGIKDALLDKDHRFESV